MLCASTQAVYINLLPGPVRSPSKSFSDGDCPVALLLLDNTKVVILLRMKMSFFSIYSLNQGVT